MSLKLILADGHAMMRDTLRDCIARQENLELIAEAKTGLEAIVFTQTLKPDIVILDDNLPDIECAVLSQKIRSQNPRTKVLAISMHPEEAYANRMFAAGASGYMLTYCAHEELSHAARALAENKLYRGPGVGKGGVCLR